MGIIINNNQFFTNDKGSYFRPIIYCNIPTTVSAKAISINYALAENISRINPKLRTLRLEHCLNQVIATLSDNSIVKDFDVLFNPAYKVDVLQLLVTACKKKSFQVIWPGKYENGKLYYAEENYPDYKMYDIEAYDVTCVI